MYSREGERRLRQQESSPILRGLRSEDRERTESKAEKKNSKHFGYETPGKQREKTIHENYPSRATTRAAKKPDVTFYGYEIKRLMDEVLDRELSTKQYESTACKGLCLSISEDIKQKVKQLGMSRYRIICHVSIGSCSGQSLLMASRFVWNDGKDNFVTATFRNVSLFAVATVFGVVKE